MSTIEGILPALITPYTANGDLHEESLRRIVRKTLKEGVDGFYVGGSTAEAFLLSTEERKRIIEIVAEEANQEAAVIFHVGSISTQTAIELAKHAKQVGVPYISAVPPFYYGFTFEQIKQYYIDIMRAVDLPFVVYNIPGYSGVNLTSNQLVELADLPNVVAIKYTSQNLYEMERVITRLQGKKPVDLLNGHDEVCLAGLSMGASGAIGSTYNVLAPQFIRLYQSFKQGNIVEARTIQQKVNNVIDALIEVGVISGIKAILEHLGIEVNGARAPFTALSAADKKLAISAFEAVQ